MIHPLPKVEFSKIHLRHPNVPKGQSVTVAQITDIHLGTWIKPKHIHQVVDHVNALAPDLIALTGDYVGYRKRDLEHCADMFGGLDGPAFAVLGNHDHWADTGLAVSVFERSDVDLLRNEARVFHHGDFSMRIVGVDDAVTKNHDVPLAHSEHEEHPFTLTLNHVPELADECVSFGSDVILSGHTHGLQFNVPGISHRLAKFAKVRYTGGYYTVGDGHLYVCRGLGSASWPRRFDAHPEVAIVTIEHGETEMIETAKRMIRLNR